ncbi:succinylglutamate-semialdehyde dehydrogenase [Phenylobacterium montanum]|uniref:N-succinylglutamate 5-semialdehyde dehydrogenase n=1 Tax=Phenylobacterium montanum TaxID=2823693 RepID=A0A975G0Q4_9CAUL|nr:succinylglutamate-semialdehyde dehydrogenase [Caulobacter sp. S6]QUD88780.1 succinylglutamate-semialdehyde dehydrogenase [Caulobacter sp. S6]
MSLSEIASINPVTGETLWSGPSAGSAEVDAAVARARKAAGAWALTSLDERIAIARTYAERVKAAAEPLARLISQETGKPFWETRTEVASVVGKVEISVAAQAERAGQSAQEAGGMIQALRHKPHGVLAVLGPYNFPAHLPNGHIVPALLAGNAVVFKPSELTPAVGLYMAELWAQAGLPEGVLQVVVGAAETGRALAGHADLNGLLFTGSATTGLALHRQFAGQPGKMLALEMGGDNPLIVWDAADTAAAAQLIVQSAYLSAGQRCTCARRLILPTGSQGDAMLDAVTALIDRIIVGAPFDEPQPFMGPVIANAAADRLVRAADELAAKGAPTIRALARPDAERPFLTPALLDVTDVSDRPDEEYFGPLLQLVRVRDFDAAIAEANHTAYGLAAGLISDDESLYRRFWAEARAGIVNWNRPLTGASSKAPFGGIGLSGNHRPSAYYAADYCAYPVAGLEQAGLGGADITQGLRA